jgi:hypothetical protein
MADQPQFTSTSRRCIVTLGIAPTYAPPLPVVIRRFGPALARLKAGLVHHGFQGGVLVWDREFPAGCPPDCHAWYAYKPFCVQAARDQGYETILWLDASIVVKAPLEPLFERIEQDGYLLVEEDHSVGEYCSDDALFTLDLGREESFQLRSCWSCAVGLSLRDPKATEFLRQWLGYAVDGTTFPGPKWSGVHGAPRTASEDPRVKGHRHDQTAASVIAWRLGMMNWLAKAEFAQYFDDDRNATRARTAPLPRHST